MRVNYAIRVFGGQGLKQDNVGLVRYGALDVCEQHWVLDLALEELNRPLAFALERMSVVLDDWICCVAE